VKDCFGDAKLVSLKILVLRLDFRRRLNSVIPDQLTVQPLMPASDIMRTVFPVTGVLPSPLIRTRPTGLGCKICFQIPVTPLRNSIYHQTMQSLPSLIDRLEPLSELYVTLQCVNPSRKYDYAKRNYFDWPVIDIERHGPKCKIGESWLYFAVPYQAKLGSLGPQERLYIGAQTQDRMFRGDGLEGDNYHHAEMRKGNGADNPVAFLNSGNQVSIFRARADAVADLVSRVSNLEELQILTRQPRTPRKHLGWWFEQYVLLSEWGSWRWNTARADKAVAGLFLSLPSMLPNPPHMDSPQPQETD
jgi:hypothetical protein